MSKTVISVEHLTKKYELGVISSGTLARDLERWWARVRKQPDPYTRIGQKDAFASVGESILALDDVSFTVEQGETLGIIGKNGAGKSTLLKILSRVTAPTSGVVKVKGRIGSLLEVGTGFHPELTGRENVYLNGAILGMKKADVAKRFDEIVAFSGVEKFIDTPVKRYSSGMHVRLGFAVAAHLDPEILIVDEVLAVGDAEFQKKCLGKMGDVANEGRTVLFVSHRLESIQALCPKSMLIHEGHITYQGDSKAVISKYTMEKMSAKYVAAAGKDGSVHLSSLWFADIVGNPKETFDCGEPVAIFAEINNPYKQALELEMSFWDSNGSKMWIFTHQTHKIPSITDSPKAKVKIVFRFPIEHQGEVLVHAGIHVTGQIAPHYVENIREGLHFFIENSTGNEGLISRNRYYCQADFSVID